MFKVNMISDVYLKVTEIVNGDSMVVKTGDNTSRKIFLASIRPPRYEVTSLCANNMQYLKCKYFN